MKVNLFIFFHKIVHFYDKVQFSSTLHTFAQSTQFSGNFASFLKALSFQNYALFVNIHIFYKIIKK